VGNRSTPSEFPHNFFRSFHLDRTQQHRQEIDYSTNERAPFNNSRRQAAIPDTIVGCPLEIRRGQPDVQSYAGSRENISPHQPPIATNDDLLVVKTRIEKNEHDLQINSPLFSIATLKVVCVR
jgi:hypothetical protein